MNPTRHAGARRRAHPVALAVA
ncbi:MAG: hypothetical protein H6R27_635, partial [Proteobacteria bacterium]|nr:hypothetical protein [Pseudomonadota bacterium]